MRTSSRIYDILKSGGFVVHYLVGRLFKVDFTAQSIIIPVTFAALFILGSVRDGTLILSGRDVGLLEHPAIWAFLGLQIALPIWIRQSLKKIEMVDGLSKEISDRLIQFLRLQDRGSKFAATICYVTGLAAFTWNTYQNQLPGIILPYDFWDSSNHLAGYWITRVYKFYLFVWLLPFCALIHVGVLYVTLRTIRERRIGGKLTLQLFHPDDVGGLGFVPGLISTPIIIALFGASIPLAGAFYVHRAFDVTPIIGSAIVIISALTAYIVPILCLRTDLLALKRDTVEQLRLLQQRYYSSISERKTLDFDTVRRANEALDYFEKICTRIRSISNYPHLARVLKYLGLTMTPSILLLIVNSYRALSPLIGLILKPA